MVGTQGHGTRFLALVLSVLLAVTMLPAAGLQGGSAHADEPAAARPETSGGDVALEGAGAPAIAEGAEFVSGGFAYRVEGGKAALVGFGDGSALEGVVVVPERASDGSGSVTVAAVELAEGQVAEGVTALSLPQTVESIETKGLASALPNLASIEVAGTEGAYSSAAGMLFRQERGEASSDGSTTLLSNAELLWAPPAMVVARIPIECKAVAEGAFADAAALETVMAFGVMESVAEGAFADEQVNRVTIVVPITNYALASEGEGRVSGSVQLSEGIPTSDKKRPWFDCGFDSDHIVSGAPFGEIDGVVAVSEEGVAEDRSLVTPLENGRSHLDLTPEEQAEKDARRGVDPDCGLSFSYQASMDLSVKWSGDATATPAHLEIPAYATIDGVKYQVTAIEPSGFAGAVFLESLVVPEGITTIGESAFANCSNLKEVELPSTLRAIDYAAFKGCTALGSVTIPNGVSVIGGEAFADCANLQSVDMAGSTYASPTAFAGTSASEGQTVDAQALEEEPVQSAAEDEGVSPYATFGPADGYDYEFNYDPNEYKWYLSSGYQERDLYDGYLYHSSPPDVETPNGYARYEGNDKFYGNALDWHSHGTVPDLYVRQDRPHQDRYITEPGSSLVFSQSWAIPNGKAITRVRNNVIYSISHATTGAGGGDATYYGYAIIPPNLRFYNMHAGKILPATYDEIFDYDNAQYYVYELKNFTFKYDDVTTAAGGVRTATYTIEDSNYRLADPGARPGHRFLGWTGPGYSEITPTSELDLRTAVAAVGEEETVLEFEGHWEDPATARFVTGTGQHIDNISYLSGDAPDLPSVQRTGFWFAGWYPTTGAGWWEGKQDGHTLYSGKMPAEAHGDVTFNAVWTPKAYTVRFDTEASKDKDGVRAVDPPGDKTFVHPSAANAINAASGLTFGVGEDGSAVGDLNVADNHYFDLTGIRKSWCADYSLGQPETKLGAYPFVGWCKIDDLAIGTVPGPSEGGNQRYWTELRERGEDGSFTDTNYFFAIFGEGWSEFSKEQCATPYTVYGVWSTTSESAISLKATQPSHISNIGDQVVDADGRGSATRGTESIRFRENMGFIGQAEATSDSDAEALHTGTQERREAGCEIDAEMNLRAPVRYGFEFLGWGAPAAASTAGDAAQEGDATVAKTTDVADADSKIYISYDEDKARESGKTGFALTEAGAGLVTATDGMQQYAGADSWSAYWRTRTVDVSLRVPLHAVSEADMTGSSTGADRNAQEGGDYVHSKATKAEYGDEGGYRWREGDASETEGGSSSGWYIAKRAWSYYDLLEYPEFMTQKDRYTYDGWYHVRKPSMTDSTDKALEDLTGTGADLTKVATYQALEADRASGKFSSVRVTGGNTGEGNAFATDAGVDVGDGFFLTGDPTAKNAGDGNAAVELWLWTSPIRINVASPIGVYLCTTNSYGQAVDPFVVGNDRRTQLEAQATFQVATGSHDLQLVGVTAEDVTAFGYEKNEDGSTVKIDGNIPKVDADSVESSAASDKVGMASKILTPKTTDKTDNLTYDAEGSRMFWVSPVPTATADQTGVVYKGDATASTEAGKAPGASNLVGDEAALKPDVETRRYFGCGYKRVKEDGTIEFALDDNDIEDALPSAADGGERSLDGFVLRRHDNYEAGSKDGLALLKYDEASKTSTYRFYYGLDMRRADFNLAGLQDLIERNSEIDYNSAFDQPLLRVKFTFAAARNPGISYFSARGGDDGATGQDGISEDTVITVGGAD